MKIFLMGGPNIGPYHHARFTAAAKLIPDFSYVKVPATDLYRPWSGDNPAPGFNILRVPAAYQTWSFLNAHRPEVVVTVGYANPSLAAAAIWAKRHEVPVFIINESTQQDKPRTRMLELAKSLFVGRVYSGCFATGQRAADYIRSLGLRNVPFWYGAAVVDNPHFFSSTPVPMREKTFLTVARLSPEKNIGTLFKAFEIYRENGGKWEMTVAGTGPAEAMLKKAVPESLRSFVKFAGWVSYVDLPGLYARASCFILPSLSEPWGLVVNEAMAAGLPILVSERCGAAPELCEEGVNGFTFPPTDPENLARRMLQISSNEGALDAMGQASSRIVRGFTPETWALTMLEISRHALRTVKS